MLVSKGCRNIEVMDGRRLPPPIVSALDPKPVKPSKLYNAMVSADGRGADIHPNNAVVHMLGTQRKGIPNLGKFQP